jgi:two-component system sensor histidine kinase FlrB
VLDAAGRVLQSNPAAEALGLADGVSWSQTEAGWRAADDAPDEFIAGPRRLAVKVTPLDSSGGRIVLLQDVTETHRLRTLSERNERLAAMGEMAAQLAHQLRTPIAAALLYAGNLENPDLAPASRIPIAQKTVSRLKHLERLIQDMLLFARGEVLGREAVRVDDLIAELTQTFEPLARARQIELCIDVSEGGETLVGNRKALVGALTNLIENALDAVAKTPQGRVTLAAGGAGRMQIFRVIDNGPGMPPDVVERLFQPFFTTRNEGTGLGLAIARGVARAHGGGIDVSSVPGQGTEFVMSVARTAEKEDT